MRWTSRYSLRSFHKLSIESKIIKIGVPSKKLWSKHEEADFCVAPVKPMPITDYFDAKKLVKWDGLQKNLVDNFTSFS